MWSCDLKNRTVIWDDQAAGGVNRQWWYLALRTEHPAEIGGFLVHSLFPLPSPEEQKHLCETLSKQFFRGRSVLVQYALPVESLEECVVDVPVRRF